MRRQQANRAVVAARAELRPVKSSGARASTNLLLRPAPLPIHTGPGGRRPKARMTGAQRNSLGQRSEWSMSQNYFTDPAWSQTVSNQRDTR